MIVVVGLTAFVVILATDDDQVTSTGSAIQVNTPQLGRYALRRRPEEGTRSVVSAHQPQVHYDGRP
jgi:hypothetical protein